MDTDGTLLNDASLAPALKPSSWSLGPGATWHSAVKNDLFQSGSECVYARGKLPFSNNGAICRPDMVFRRVMLNQAQPDSLLFRNIWVTNPDTNLSTYVYFQHYNEDGYQVS